jgi:hypothetical protein
MTVIAAPLTASCLFPDAAPPDLSKSFEASAMAKLIRSVLDLFPAGAEDEPPDVNCLRIWSAAAEPRELAFRSPGLPSL